jgi:hypothetical protein
MAYTYKVLGQASLAANTLTTVYSVPSANSAVVSTVTICNRGNTATTFRLAVQPANASISTQHYINFDTNLPANDTVALTLGITLAATDVISANVPNSNVSVSVFGSEIY